MVDTPYTREMLSKYYSEISHFDQTLGEYMDYLRDTGVVQPGSRNDALIQIADVAPTLLDAVDANPDTVHTGIPNANGDTGFDGKSFLDVEGTAKDHRKYVYGVH